MVVADDAVGVDVVAIAAALTDVQGTLIVTIPVGTGSCLAELLVVAAAAVDVTGKSFESVVRALDYAMIRSVAEDSVPGRMHLIVG